MKPKPSASTFRGVLLLWSIIVIVFVAFNFCFWPVVAHQAAVDPARYLDRAEELYAMGERGAAIEWLRRGIEAHRPPVFEPYDLIYKWCNLENRAVEARPYKAKASFYRAWVEAETMERGHLLESAVVSASDVAPMPRLVPETGRAVDAMALFLADQFGLRTLAGTWSQGRRTALLSLSGEPFCRDRLIGNTGVHSPVDLIVLSGGGAGKTRAAKFLAGTQLFEASRRGLHVLLLEPSAPEKPVLQAFDLWGSEAEASRLVERLGALPAGTICAFAVMDNAATAGNRAVDEVLLEFGLEQEAVINREPVLIGERFSLAAIGVKGAPRGSAVQAWSPGKYDGVTGHPVAVGVVQQLEQTP